MSLSDGYGIGKSEGIGFAKEGWDDLILNDGYGLVITSSEGCNV